MRLWTLHPRYLDSIGLVALWREALLAKAVLRGRTVGYRRHPQLERFQGSADPVGAVNAYLTVIHAEATRRGYRFDSTKLRGRRAAVRMRCTRGQIAFEWEHLLRKVKARSPAHYRVIRDVSRPRAHPQFRICPGPVANWEKGKAD